MTTSSDDSDLWIRRFHQAPDSRVQLVCFPHAGGSASFYFPMSEALAPVVEVLSIQYPGRQDRRREQCLDKIEDMADQVLRTLRPQIDTPVAFFGHSMGAVIAYEVARRLEHEAGVTLAALFASGRRAPSRSREEALHLRGEASIIAELRALSGTNAALLDDEELRQMILPAVRADYRAIERYRHRPGPELSCPMYVLVGASDPRTTRDEADAWRQHTTGEFTVQVFPGGHFYLTEVASRVIGAISDGLLPYTSDAVGPRP
ncbi:alpha/beta fold hydrolase [Plantactinospora sp. ZYX-F-223]|uniref:thioesterase II family protein n=1 Tax=Plantactinospora sp. ZYX-F-223 TaxID=3144103 RepID=UPI0031FC555A